MTKIILVLPVYKEYYPPISDEVLLWPEYLRTPAESVQHVKAWLDIHKNAECISVISGSPYVMKIITTIIVVDILVFSDGRNVITREEFWTHFAHPMQEIFFTKPITTNG